MNKNYKVSIESATYFLLGTMLVIGTISFSTLSYAYDLRIFGYLWIGLRFLLISLVILDCFAHRTTLEKYLLLVGFAAVVLFSYLLAGTWFLFDVFFVAIFLGKRVRYHKIVNMFFRTLETTLVLIVALNLVGLLPEVEFIRFDNRIRYNLGFSHPNALGFFVYMICMLYALKKGDRYRLHDSLLLIIAGLFVYLIPNSITASLLIFLLAFIYVIPLLQSKLSHRKKSEVSNKAFRRAILAFAVIIVGVYLVALKGIGAQLIYSLSGTFYTRFRYGLEAINRYGIHLFGTMMQIYGDSYTILTGDSSKYFSLDCLYFYMPIRYGLVTSLVSIVLYIYCMYRCVKNRNRMLFASLCVNMLYAISETNAVTLPISFLFICALSRDDRVAEEVQEAVCIQNHKRKLVNYQQH